MSNFDMFFGDAALKACASITKDDARRRRDEGIQNAVAGANRLTPGWDNVAFEYLRRFLREHNDPFLTEDVRMSALAWGLEDGGKAWGHVMLRAQKGGLIVKVGYGSARTSNMSPKVLWRKA